MVVRQGGVHEKTFACWCRSAGVDRVPSGRGFRAARRRNARRRGVWWLSRGCDRRRLPRRRWRLSRRDGRRRLSRRNGRRRLSRRNGRRRLPRRMGGGFSGRMGGGFRSAMVGGGFRGAGLRSGFVGSRSFAFRPGFAPRFARFNRFGHRRFAFAAVPFAVGVGLYGGSCWTWQPTPWGWQRVWACDYDYGYYGYY